MTFQIALGQNIQAAGLAQNMQAAGINPQDFFRTKNRRGPKGPWKNKLSKNTVLEAYPGLKGLKKYVISPKKSPAYDPSRPVGGSIIDQNSGLPTKKIIQWSTDVGRRILRDMPLDVRQRLRIDPNQHRLTKKVAIKLGLWKEE